MSDFQIDVWPADSRQITQPFGVNADFYQRFGTPGHMGIDVGGVEGVTKVYAVAPGRVSSTGNHPDGYGKHAFVDHGNGYKTIYAHLDSLAVSPNQPVDAGTEIGKLGNTGSSTGAHLHFEMRGPRGLPGWPRNIIDPSPFLMPLLGFVKPAGPYKEGWVVDWSVTVVGELAQVNASPVNMRSGAGTNHAVTNTLQPGTMLVVNGEPKKGGEYTFLPVKVPFASIGETPPAEHQPPPPAPEFPPMMSTIKGWGFAPEISSSDGLRGRVGQYGINLRGTPDRNGPLIGLVGGNSVVTITGQQKGEYLPVEAAKDDFIGEIDMSAVAPEKPAPGTLSGNNSSNDDTFLGWGSTAHMEVQGTQAVTNQYGINLRAKPNGFGTIIGVAKGNAIVTIVGKPDGAYTPVLVKRDNMLSIDNPNVAVDVPESLDETAAPAAPPPPPQTVVPPAQSTPGWAFATALQIRGQKAIANQYGINLRNQPNRTGDLVGFVPGGTEMVVTGGRQGEYVPVRVADDKLEDAPVTAAGPTAPSSAQPTRPAAPPRPGETTFGGNAKLGLHASATHHIDDSEIAEFKALRPGMIKVMSHHNPDGIQKLAKNHPDASWVVRAFLSFQGRTEKVSPDQFVNDTIGDMKRTLGHLQGKDVVIELHNEPNLTVEGYAQSWTDAAGFNQWWMQVLGKYRQQLPGYRYLFPGLSPGPSAAAYGGQRTADRPFLETCRPAINAADGLAMHAYWSNPHFPMKAHADSGTQLVDDYIRRFPNKQIWITEASNNQGTDWDQKAKDYIEFWQAMQARPSVQGITYFVASAAPGTFDHEVWVGNGIAAKLGVR